MISQNVEPTKKMNLQPPSFSSLPAEITESILARVSRWNYPRLSLVSKSFRSLLSSTQIYKTRSQIGAKETCVYVVLKFNNQPFMSWFGLWSKPNQPRTKRRGKVRLKQSPNRNVVVPIHFSSSQPPLIPDSIEEVGSDIYIFGRYNESSSSIQIFDCLSHTLRDAPKMTVARDNARTAFLDEKIYVLGGCEVEDYPDNWIEVFDIKSQSWTALPGPGDHEEELRGKLRREYCHIFNAFEGKIYVVVDGTDYTYELKDGTWKVIREQSNFRSIKMWWWTENVMYCCTYTKYLMWSDPECKEWREIKGLEKLHEHRTRGLKVGRVLSIAECDGKLLVMWDPYTNRMSSGIKRGIKIWYAIICLESRCNGHEVWGDVECVDVLTFPGKEIEELYCFTASV